MSAGLPARWQAGLARLRAGLGLPAGGDLRVVQALPLGPGTRLLVVDFGGRRLLIGQSRAGLARLADTEVAP
ncbi:hypothetical protein IP88_01865 [alpha proteobacterium AAP81b]|nr:hypothetical protein IP88_01865 [alpha proteobacterium AAP81b]